MQIDITSLEQNLEAICQNHSGWLSLSERNVYIFQIFLYLALFPQQFFRGVHAILNDKNKHCYHSAMFLKSLMEIASESSGKSTRRC